MRGVLNPATGQTVAELPEASAEDVDAAVLAGRTASDVIYNALSIMIMTITGLLVGWRIRGSILEAVTGFVLVLAFAYAISWVMAFIGLIVPSVEVINNASFMVIFPMSFVAVFAPLAVGRYKRANRR